VSKNSLSKLANHASLELKPTVDILGADLDCEEWKNWKLKVEFFENNNVLSDFSLIFLINLFER